MTRLGDGRVLVMGGMKGYKQVGAFPNVSFVSIYLSSAELYDPNACAWSPAADDVAARWSHVAALLWSGKVLVAGGSNGGGTLASASIYTP